MRYGIVQGWTAPMDFNLLSKGASPSGDMVGMSAALILRNAERTLDTSGDVTIPDTSLWTVRYTPDATDLVPGIFKMRIKVTDSGGAISYFPSDEWDIMEVRSEA